MEVGRITDLPFVVNFCHLPASPKPAADALHRCEFYSVFKITHGKDLSFDIVIKEFIPLHHQMVLDRRILSNLVTALV